MRLVLVKRVRGETYLSTTFVDVGTVTTLVIVVDVVVAVDVVVVSKVYFVISVIKFINGQGNIQPKY
jgi:hypothetical protein